VIHGPKIAIVGTGKVAQRLAKRLKAKGVAIAQVYGRNGDAARQLADDLHCEWTSDMGDLAPDTDWLLIAVSDDAIATVAAQLSEAVPLALATHTSGATPGAVLGQYFRRYGVFYPLQSFSVDRQPVWSKIPFCVDAFLPEDTIFLKKMAKIVGNRVYQVNDQQRATLHVAAVFANNFTNHCFSIAEKILDGDDLPFEMLHPLMEETLAKALADSPAKMQTGPAIRGDEATMQRHLELLKAHKGWGAIYRDISEDIKGG
jgi:predicted short-subunit dehydrogenase-like oxidoreductase (DUF2520 family)